MNNRNQQTARSTAPAEASSPTYLNVFTAGVAGTILTRRKCPYRPCAN